MTIAEAYLSGSRVFLRLKNGPHGQLSSATWHGLSRMVSRDTALGDASTWSRGS